MTNPHPSQGQMGQNGDFTVELNKQRPVCPRDGSQFVPGGVPFVQGTVPVCPGHRPAQNLYVYWFFSCPIHNKNKIFGPYPQHGWVFPEETPERPGTLSEPFLEFPSRVRLGSPKPCSSRHLRLPEHFQNSLPLSTAGGDSFFQRWFRRGPLRAGRGIPSSTEGISDFCSEFTGVESQELAMKGAALTHTCSE